MGSYRLTWRPLDQGQLAIGHKPGARPPAADRDEEIRAAFARMDVELASGGRLYVHCSAGLHRTGMFAFAYLRHRGLSPAEAVALIRELRPLTADELTEERLAWGHKFAGSGAT
jgi:protein-tyrosine phosphatase